MDHTADFLKFISSAQSFWISLDTSYGHGCHLANRFSLEPIDYEVLLVVASLVHYTRFGFALKPTAWSKFLGGVLENRQTYRQTHLGPDLAVPQVYRNTK